MTTAATIVTKLVLEDAGYDSGMSKAQTKTNSFHSNFMNKMKDLGSRMAGIGGMLAKAALVAGTVAIVALGNELYRSVDAAAQAQEVQAQLNAVLESTGGVAGVTADQVNELADKFSGLTKFEDEAIISGENMLLTFTNIGKDIFPQVTETMLDMSQALGQDLTASAMQLGKALNDPIQGVSALRRVGVAFTEEQEKMIKSLVESGNLQEAQTMILQELQKEFGGSAEAAGKTFAGQLTILQNKLGNIRESIGTKLLPVLMQLATTFSDYLNQPEVQKFIEDAGTALADFAETAISKLPDVFKTIQQGFGWLQDNKGVIVAVLAVLTASMVAFAWSTIAASLPIILVMAAIGLAAYVLYEAWTNNWGGIQEKTAAFWAWLQPVLQGIWNWLSVNIPVAIQNFQTWWSNTLPVIMEVWSAITDAWDAGMQFIEDLTSGKLGAISEIWSNTTSFIQDYISRGFANIKMIFAAFKAAFSGDWRTFGLLLGQIWRNTWDGLLSMVRTAGSNIKSAISGLISTLTSLWRSINWTSVGTTIMNQVWTGIRNVIPNILSAISTFISTIVDMLSGFLDGVNMGSPIVGGTTGTGNSNNNGGVGGGTPYAQGTGKWLTVPSGYEDDSFMIRMKTDEQYYVAKPGEALPSGGGGTNNYYNPLITIVNNKPDPRLALKGLT